MDAPPRETLMRVVSPAGMEAGIMDNQVRIELAPVSRPGRLKALLGALLCVLHLLNLTGG